MQAGIAGPQADDASVQDLTPGGVVPVQADTFTTCMEQLQEGYVLAVAAAAGCLVEPVTRDIYGADLRIVKTKGPDVEEVALLVQLKATTTKVIDHTKATFGFKFKTQKQLRHLVKPRTTQKAILIVLATQPSQATWAQLEANDFLRIRRCCYWVCLEGHAVDPDVAQPTVQVPSGNRFDADALHQIFAQIEAGTLA